MSFLCKMFGHSKLNMIGSEVRQFNRTGYVDERFPVSLGTYRHKGHETVYHLRCERCGMVLVKVVTGAIPDTNQKRKL